MTDTAELRKLAEAATLNHVKHMVNRFLGWKLPKDFAPDAGISFDPTYNKWMDNPPRWEPVGTNLFTATQAEAMVRYMLEGLPDLEQRVAADMASLAKDAEIERLKKDVGTYGRHYDRVEEELSEARAEITALKEKVKRQAEALKPWANLAEQCGFPYNDNDPVLITNGVNYVKHAFTVGDLRRAAQEAGHE